MGKRTEFRHAVKRCTSEAGATKALDELSNAGYGLLSVTSGGGEGNVIWMVFQRQVHVVEEPAPIAGAPATSVLSGLGQQPAPT